MGSKPIAVVRTIGIDASPQHVADVIADFGSWRQWARLPQLQDTTQIDVTSTDGLPMLRWHNDPKEGDGHLRLLLREGNSLFFEVKSPRRLKWANIMLAETQPAGKASRVRWTIYGEVRGIKKYTSFVVPVAKRFGPQLSASLAELKSLVERQVTAG